MLVDERNKSISFKVRGAIEKRIPLIASIGKNEATNKTVSLKRLGDKESKDISIKDLTDIILKESTI